MPPFADPSQLVSQVLSGICASSAPEYDRAMARNLLAEHRLSKSRFQLFSTFAGAMDDLEAIRSAVQRYHANEVRPLVSAGIEPAYTRPENQQNLVNLPPRTQVATVLNLSGLERIYAEAWKTFRIPEFRMYDVTSPLNSQQVNDFLSPRLTDPAQREPFLQAIFRALRRYRNSPKVERRIRTCWVAEWKALQPFLDSNIPERWSQAVGVPSDDAAWLAVFRYPLHGRGKEIPLFRPTQLDAGWYGHHFPSPPGAPLEKGGHAMYLAQDGAPVAPRDLVPEYLHAQIDFTMAQWRAAGGLLGMARRVGGDLREQRRGHWTLLQETYGNAPIATWMLEYL